jgi:hypothetical protein
MHDLTAMMSPQITHTYTHTRTHTGASAPCRPGAPGCWASWHKSCATAPAGATSTPTCRCCRPPHHCVCTYTVCACVCVWSFSRACLCAWLWGRVRTRHGHGPSFNPTHTHTHAHTQRRQLHGVGGHRVGRQQLQLRRGRQRGLPPLLPQGREPGVRAWVGVRVRV